MGGGRGGGGEGERKTGVNGRERVGKGVGERDPGSGT